MDIGLNHLHKLPLAGKPSAVIAFPLQNAPEALHGAVINAVRYAGHTLRHSHLHELVVESAVGVLESSVTIPYHAYRRLYVLHRQTAFHARLSQTYRTPDRLWTPSFLSFRRLWANHDHRHLLWAFFRAFPVPDLPLGEAVPVNLCCLRHFLFLVFLFIGACFDVRSVYKNYTGIYHSVIQSFI